MLSSMVAYMGPDKDTEWGEWRLHPMFCHGLDALLLATPLGSATQGCPISREHAFAYHLLSLAFVVFV